MAEDGARLTLCSISEVCVRPQQQTRAGRTNKLDRQGAKIAQDAVEMQGKDRALIARQPCSSTWRALRIGKGIDVQRWVVSATIKKNKRKVDVNSLPIMSS